MRIFRFFFEKVDVLPNIGVKTLARKAGENKTPAFIAVKNLEDAIKASGLFTPATRAFE